jgi:hypothetical protein
LIGEWYYVRLYCIISSWNKPYLTCLL